MTVNTTAIACSPPPVVPAASGEAAVTSRILLGVFRALDCAGVPHCVLHGYDTYPEHIPSDVDCLIADVPAKYLAALIHEGRKRVGAGIVRFSSGHLVLAGEN